MTKPQQAVLSKEDFAHIEAKLIDEQSKLQKQIMTESKKQHSVRSTDSDQSILAERVVFFERRLRRRRKAKKMLSQIDKALHRLKRGTYGLCSRCGEKINIERLYSMPTADMCIRCQRNKDKNR